MSKEPLASDSHNLRGAAGAVNRSHRSTILDPVMRAWRERYDTHLRRLTRIAEVIAVVLLTLALCLLVTRDANAGERGWITEIGGGVKLPSSSYLTLPACKKATVVDPPLPPANPRPAPQVYSCGGDNPLFVGWVGAYQFSNGVRVGWFHQSQWFDSKGELHFDCVCASYTINWSERIRRWRTRR